MKRVAYLNGEGDVLQGLRRHPTIRKAGDVRWSRRVDAVATLGTTEVGYAHDAVRGHEDVAGRQ